MFKPLAEAERASVVPVWQIKHRKIETAYRHGSAMADADTRLCDIVAYRQRCFGRQVLDGQVNGPAARVECGECRRRSAIDRNSRASLQCRREIVLDSHCAVDVLAVQEKARVPDGIVSDSCCDRGNRTPAIIGSVIGCESAIGI